MPKDNRLILNGVRVGNTVYTEGQEDELSGALTQAELDRLMDSGALGGDFVSTLKPAKTETAEKETDPNTSKK